jgi:acyl-CoA reductase-like NAD-dependent aldehyde dehydrogenase
MPVVDVPVLRAGRAYRSRRTVELGDVRTGEPVARVSQANAGLIARDLARAAPHRARLSAVPVAERLAACRRAASRFARGDVALDDLGHTIQSADDYVRVLSSTTGMPRSLCRANAEKIRFVLDDMETVLSGLTRALDLDVLERGWGTSHGHVVSYRSRTDVLGAVLPNNSPGVHSLWIPAVALGVPLALRPGRLEPWTPLRVLRALVAEGIPEESFGFYPSDHAGATEILLRSGRSMLFGDEGSIAPWRGDARVAIHGPGFSKVILGPDEAASFEQHVDLIVESIAANGGRSCLNASGVWTPSHGRELAEALADRLARIEARPLDDPGAVLAAFPDASSARRISDLVDSRLRVPGAVDLTATRRKSRVVEVDGCTFLLPTVVWCEAPDHPLASTELLFPFASVVEARADDIPERIGPTLVATVLSGDASFRSRLLDCRSVDRLNLGPVPTYRIGWDQPHEGNLFDHLFERRALQAAAS